MKIIGFINIIAFFVLIISGLIYFVRNRNIFLKVTQIQIDKRTIISFILAALIGVFVLLMIFISNRHLGYITIESTHDLLSSLKQIPSDFINAFGEELLLRVLIFVALLNLNRNKIIALIGSSIIFGFLHFPSNLISTISYFIAGLMYGIALLRFKTIWAPIGLHFTWNYFQGAILGFPVSGQLSKGYFILNIENNLIWNGGRIGPEGSIVGVASRILIIGLIILVSNFVKDNESEYFLKL